MISVGLFRHLEGRRFHGLDRELLDAARNVWHGIASSHEFDLDSENKHGNHHFRDQMRSISLIKMNGHQIRLAASALFLVLAALNSYAAAPPVGFYFEVEKDGRRSFVLGSIHALIDPATLPGFIHETFQKAKTVVFEADPDEFQSRYSIQILNAAILPMGETLEAKLPGDALNKLRELLPEAAVEIALRSQPWAVSRQLSKLAEDRVKTEGHSVDVTSGIDMQFLKTAKADAAKQMIYLESADEIASQTGTSYGIDDLIQDLRLDDPIGTRLRCIQQFAEAYRAGDESLLFKDADVCIGTKTLALFNRRSLRWQPRLGHAIETGSAFVTVGAIHLFGPDGILKYLKESGYRVTRLFPSQASR